VSNASRITLLVFLASVAAVLGLLGFMTARVLELERDEVRAKFDARQQENLRLALWRMDSVIAPIIAQEAARPYFHYLSYYPEQRAFTRVWEPVLPGEVIVPSPLVEGTPPFVQLHFQVGATGLVQSPQVPRGNDRDLAESEPGGAERVARFERTLQRLSTFVAFESLADAATAMSSARDSRAPTGGQPPAVAQAQVESGQRSLSSELAEREYGYRKEAAEIASAPSPVLPQTSGAQPDAPAFDATAVITTDELSKKSRVGLGAEDAEERGDGPSVRMLGARAARGMGTRADLSQSRFVPRWRTDPATGAHELLFWRAVRADNAFTVQGFWIDWIALRSTCFHGSMTCSRVRWWSPSRQPRQAGQTWLRASWLRSRPWWCPLPSLRLRCRSSPPSHVTLALTWLATLGAIAAVGLSLRASIALGERRGRFVSAVTHELRTPLTTFCLYSQMLADGMVTEESARQEYLRTLKTEATRLQRIVENVLEFARLGRASQGRTQLAMLGAETRVGDILDQAMPTLRQRAEQAGMTLVQTIEGHVRDASVAISADATGRVLLNLVDNACKYASEAADPDDHLGCSGPTGPCHVHDHGSGPGRARARKTTDLPIVCARAFTRVERRSGSGLGAVAGPSDCEAARRRPHARERAGLGSFVHTLHPGQFGHHEPVSGPYCQT
jgi:signal transduction histidine kinase